MFPPPNQDQNFWGNFMQFVRNLVATASQGVVPEQGEGAEAARRAVSNVHQETGRPLFPLPSIFPGRPATPRVSPAAAPRLKFRGPQSAPRGSLTPYAPKRRKPLIGGGRGARFF